MIRPYSKSRHTSSAAVRTRLRQLEADVFECVLDSHSELIRASSVGAAARKAASLHKLTLGPVVIEGHKVTDRTGYRVTYHGGMFGGDKESVLFVSRASIR